VTVKDNWRKQPQAMLLARATAECARMTASDAILGIPYASEELADDGPVSAPPAEVKPARRTAQRAPRPVEPPPEPDLEEPAATEDTDAEDLINEAQSKKLHAQLRELGKGDRDAGLAEVSRILGREVTTTKTLSRFDAGRVLDDLDAQLLARKAPPEPDLDDDWPATVQPPDGA
jgi:hypothetical protein